MKTTLLLLLFIFNIALVRAQSTGVEMAADLRSSGMIYVVVAIILIVFSGIAVYLFSIDRRLKKIERNK